jgi:hypothetical protein
MLMAHAHEADNAAMTIRRDERGVIINWLVKVLITLAILGVAVFDAGSIAVNFFGLSSAADDAAIAVATAVQGGGVEPNNPKELNDRAVEAVADTGAQVVEVTVDREGNVHVKLKRRAKTLVVGRIGPIKHWARATAEGTSGTN